MYTPPCLQAQVLLLQYFELMNHLMLTLHATSCKDIHVKAWEIAEKVGIWQGGILVKVTLLKLLEEPTRFPPIMDC